MLAIIRTMVMLVVTAVTIIGAAVMIIVTPLFAIVIIMVLRAIRAGGPLSFLGIGVAVRYLY